MNGFEQKAYRAFDMFNRQTPLVTAGSLDNFNGCTLGWGSMGNIWSRADSANPIITVYVYPSRYTCDFLKANNSFTVCFFPEEYRSALAYMGSHSGRDEDKVKNAGLTPVALEDSVMYKESELTFLCKKLYQHEFSRSDLAEEIREYYKASPKAYPLDENGDWQTHYMFIGEVIRVIDNRPNEK